MPLTVLIAWMMGKDLDLDFFPFESAVYFIAILLGVIVTQHASSNWLKGSILLAAYAFICAGFWVHDDRLLLAE